MKLTPEDLARLQNKEVANAIRKLQEGKTLTTGERALLAQASVGSGAITTGGFAQTWEDLSRRLGGVSRRSLQEWRRDPRYAPHCPVARADGRHDVAACSPPRSPPKPSATSAAEPSPAPYQSIDQSARNHGPI